MVIKSIEDATMYYEVGKLGVTSIELTQQGGKNTNIYKVTNDKGEYLFVGMLKAGEKVEYEERE